MFANARKGRDRGVLYACTWPQVLADTLNPNLANSAWMRF
jgi:hypothetical protein